MIGIKHVECCLESVICYHGTLFYCSHDEFCIIDGTAVVQVYSGEQFVNLLLCNRNTKVLLIAEEYLLL